MQTPLLVTLLLFCWILLSEITSTSFISGSRTLCWALAAFSASSAYTQSVGHPRHEISLSQGRYSHTEPHKQRINAYIHLELDSKPRPQNSNEDSLRLRPRGLCALLLAVNCYLFSLPIQLLSYIPRKFSIYEEMWPEDGTHVLKHAAIDRKYLECKIVVVLIRKMNQ